MKEKEGTRHPGNLNKGLEAADRTEGEARAQEGGEGGSEKAEGG